MIGDYEDSDLCLKIRRIGLQIVYEPAACLYHLERRSIRRSQDYMRGVASQYNSWLHAALGGRHHRPDGEPTPAKHPDRRRHCRRHNPERSAA